MSWALTGDSSPEHWYIAAQDRPPASKQGAPGHVWPTPHSFATSVSLLMVYTGTGPYRWTFSTLLSWPPVRVCLQVRQAAAPVPCWSSRSSLQQRVRCKETDSGANDTSPMAVIDEILLVAKDGCVGGLRDGRRLPHPLLSASVPLRTPAPASLLLFSPRGATWLAFASTSSEALGLANLLARRRLAVVLLGAL
ncbi:uncharacterized protein PSFLO_00146 [Pseudozyma flocculosa]|uniref:Uncharacterized protein n=1 Tax=Pseudozyma flocculosa TaxID=84751 RepID=A0A5C3ESJ7_9BASI|nr:uncharacterized protein PSFLO_00146 [Pseudozyma flocculosa]